MWPFTKKREDSGLNKLTTVLKKSFSNIKADMEKLTSFSEAHKEEISKHTLKHESHEEKISNILNRIEMLEISLSKKEEQLINPLSEHNFKTTTKIADQLTEKQHFYCQVIAALQKENPNEWISLKNLGLEIYPDKKYHQIRSMVSQYISLLLDLGFIERVYKGRQAFIRSTDANPYYKKLVKTLESKKKRQKSD